MPLSAGTWNMFKLYPNSDLKVISRLFIKRIVEREHFDKCEQLVCLRWSNLILGCTQDHECNASRSGTYDTSNLRPVHSLTCIPSQLDCA